MRHAWLLVLVGSACDPGPELMAPAAMPPDAGSRPTPVMERDAGPTPMPTQRGPNLRAVSPAEGVAGTLVELTVEELLGVPTVSFGSLAAQEVQVAGVNLVRCRAPAGEGLLDVTVRTSGGDSSLPRAFRLARGSLTPDAGTTSDAGSMAVDAGRVAVDAGRVAVDAGMAPGRQSAFTLEAEAASSLLGVQPVGDTIGFIDDGDWLAFDAVVFGAGVDSVEVRLATPNAGGRLEFRLDDPMGALLGTLVVTSTGSWSDRQPQRVALTRTTGTRRLVVVAKGRPDVANLDSFTFNP